MKQIVAPSAGADWLFSSGKHIQRNALKFSGAAIIALAAITAPAQSKLAEEIKSPADVKVLLDFPKEGRNTKNGKGFSANIGLLPNGVKRVGLVSFFAFDPGTTQTWTTSSPSTKTTYVRKRSTGGISSEIAYGALVTALEPMMNKFKEYGVEILTPDQFLDTDEKKTAYQNFEVKREKFAKFLNNLGSGGHDKMYGYAEPFRVIDIVGEPFDNYSKKGLLITKSGKIPDKQIFLFDKDTKLTESIGYELCSALGLDAVIVTYMTVFVPGNNKIQLQNVRMVMFGPNPVMPEGESKHGVIPHVKGLFYVGTSTNPEQVIYNKNKKDPESDKLNFAGFDHIYVALATKMGEYIKESKE